MTKPIDWRHDGEPIYSVAGIRQLEQEACAVLAVDADGLMVHAGQALFDYFCDHWSLSLSVVVFCGSGNNGGDGYVFARLALLAGVSVEVHAAARHDEQEGVVGDVARAFVAAGGRLHLWDGQRSIQADLWVDALLGIGFHGYGAGYQCCGGGGFSY